MRQTIGTLRDYFFCDTARTEYLCTADWGRWFMSTRLKNLRWGCLQLFFGTIVAVLFSVVPEGKAQSKDEISFLILSTVEPLMITKPDDPMAGGIITEIVEAIFVDTEYEVVPKVMPWKRMAEELRTGSDWVTYGFPGGFDLDMPNEMSKLPVLSFNHVAITLKSNHFKVVDASDVSGKTAILVENFHYPGLDPYLDMPVVGDGDGTIKTVRAFSPKGTLRMLQHGRGDVVFGYHARMLYNLKILAWNSVIYVFRTLHRSFLRNRFI